MAQPEIWCWHSRKYGGVVPYILVSSPVQSWSLEFGLWTLDLDLTWTGLSLDNKAKENEKFFELLMQSPLKELQIFWCHSVPVADSSNIKAYF